jgi:hypothetical protein
MPWSLSQRDGKWCVIKESDGSTAGCHESRADAIKQQRALYANDSRMASLYDELDERSEEWTEPVVQAPAKSDSSLSPLATELVGLLLKDEREKSLIASLASSMESISEHVAKTDEERAALVAALGTVSQPIVNVPAPVVNVEVPDITVEAPQVTVEQPAITVEAPNVRVEAAEAPVIHIHQPSAQKTVTFERDPLTGDVTKAEVTEN